MEWRSWSELGGDLKAGSTPSIIGSHRRELSLLARLGNGRVGMAGRSTAGWFDWTDLGLNCRDAPAMTVQSGRMVVAARGTDDGLWVGGSQQWTACGGSLASGPSIAAWKLDGNAEIFARGADATLQWFSFGNFGAATHNASPSPQRIVGTPTAVAPGPNSIHVFARREGDSRLIHSAWDYLNWSAWTDLGEVITSSPSVVSRDVGTLEVYFADAGGALVRRSFRVNNNLQLVSAGPRDVLAPAVLGDPAAASLGPWHVEVFHRQTNGALVRIYSEGIVAPDDAGLALLGNQLVDSAPSMWAESQDVVVCAARNANNQLVTLTAENGFWGDWENHGGFLDSDPVIVARFASALEVIARDNNQQLIRWTRLVASWSGPTPLPAAPTGWCVGQPRAFPDWQGGARIVTRVNTDRLYEAVIGSNGAFQRWNDLGGGSVTQQPELVQLNQNVLPAPFAGARPRFAMEAGHWVVVPDVTGTLRGRQYAGTSWGPWQVFSPPATTVRRPIAVMSDFGFSFAQNDSQIPGANQAGWIGRAANGSILQQRMVWVRRSNGYAVGVFLDSSPWTASPTPIDLSGDLTGAHYPEPAGNTPGGPVYLTTNVFSRSPQGHLQWLWLTTPTAGPLRWQWLAPGYRLAGDVAPLVQWSSYENNHVLIAAAVTTGRTLLVGVAGTGPAPQRVQPQRTQIAPVRPIFPIRPVRPVRPGRPRPGP